MGRKQAVAGPLNGGESPLTIRFHIYNKSHPSGLLTITNKVRLIGHIETRINEGWVRLPETPNSSSFTICLPNSVGNWERFRFANSRTCERVLRVLESQGIGVDQCQR